MKKFLSMIMVVIMFVMLIGCSGTNEESQLSTKEKAEDFEYMYEVIKEGYPFLEVNKRLNNEDWLANKDKYLEKIKNTTNDDEFVNVMTEIVMELNNGHTHIINDRDTYNFVKSVYSQANWYDFLDNEEVINRYKSTDSTEKSTKSPIIKKNVTVKDVIEGKIGYMHLPQMYMVSEGITKEDIEKDMKIIDDYINTLENHQALIIDIRGNTGGSDTYWTNIVSKVTPKYIERKGYLAFKTESDIMRNYVNKKGIELKPIENLPKEVLNNAPKEVLTKFSEFHESILGIKSNKTSKFKGNIYLLVDKSVYSSSESFSIFCKDTGFATLIGETTGGDGGGIDPVLFNLKNSGIIVRMSSDMYLTEKGICNEEFKTTPDYEVEGASRTEKFEDDKCIQKVLKLENIN
ncbi:S41 family peptidase [Clostridium sp. CCUG 7971]|uniref:S41 family peptidase n=1 Tax=Clostridium sp. CCUG 7971 TaxID=2811414 RepID=UPI001ABAC96E|nr:peptidase S41 [Clostridium sp. CCUG 7971]